MRAFSADGHLVEPPDAFAGHVERAWRDVAPRLVRRPGGGEAYVLDGIGLALPIDEILGAGVRDTTWGAVPRASWDADARVAYQEANGLRGELLFPTVGLFLGQHPDPAYQYRFAAAYNRWLADRWCGRGEGLSMVAILGRHDSAAARSAAVRWTAEHRFAGILLPSEPCEASWSAAHYAPFFSELADAGLLACFHAFSRPVTRGVSRAAAAIFAASHQAMDVCCEIALGGVLAREPRLRVLFGEGETWWLPHWVERMRGAGADLGAVRRGLRVTSHRPSPGDDELVVYAADFPHGSGGADGDTIEWAALEGAAPAFADGSFCASAGR